MIKLFILDEISGFSSDSVFKICLSLESKGFSEENIERFFSYDELLDALIPALERGEHVIVAAENDTYISVKRDIISKLILEESSSPIIAEVITKNAGDDIGEIDLGGHCLVPSGAKLLISTDGLYSGFSQPILEGKLTMLPLDFLRADEILSQLHEKVIEREERLSQMGLDREIEMPDYDLVPCVEGMVSALRKSGKGLALATGDATMWIYNLYDRVDSLTETVSFVEVSDDPATLDENESESSMLIRHAREAMLNAGADYGAAISDIYSTENSSGQTIYFAYAAVVDKTTASAKKINISDEENLAIILPHALTLMSEMIQAKIDAASKALARKESMEAEASSSPAAPAATEKSSSSKMFFLGILAVIAVIIPVLLVFTVFNQDEPTTTAPFISDYNSGVPTLSTQNPFGVQSSSSTSAFSTGTEPTVTDASATPTTTQRVSESGMFTFYVFGHGHGVGLSQHGANYLAKQGWSYAEILAHYYYDADGNTKLLINDTYPETIKYAGAEYSTREYLAKVLEAEMGSSFHSEALKAQAVAIYTFAKYHSFNLDKDAHAFTAGAPSNAVYSAVDFVMQNGLYVSYLGDVAATPFHAMSAGVTTSYYNVWGKDIGVDPPYLKGGRRSPGDYEATNYQTTITIPSAELKALIEANDPSITLVGDPATWISIVSHDTAINNDIGYVSTINVGGKLYTGNQFRTVLLKGKIRSHCFMMVYTPDVI